MQSLCVMIRMRLNALVQKGELKSDIGVSLNGRKEEKTRLDGVSLGEAREIVIASIVNNTGDNILSNLP